MHSVHTTSFPELLSHWGITLAVSTYQANKLIFLRADGDVLNTHFRSLNRPMGIALTGSKLAIGTSYEIWEFRDVPAVAQKLEPAGKHDACYLPRTKAVTGDINIHEMAYAQDELWIVNTSFSCLCTLDANYSFVPRWHPPFISGYDVGDRCHLNGLGVRDDQPKYVTALGETDVSGAWRDNKANGGILMDMQTNQVLSRGLSMPHSPRWYAGQLWFLESGEGELATVDPASGQKTRVAQFPGFPRGLDFVGSLAFVGLSQVRETAVFSGIPLVERLAERTCGVWVVNINTGEIVAFLQFKEGVEEIFSVTVLPNRFPDLVESDEDLLSATFVLPDWALQDYVPPSTKG